MMGPLLFLFLFLFEVKRIADAGFSCCIRLKILINYLTPLTKYDSITYERKKDCTKCSIIERYHRYLRYGKR